MATRARIGYQFSDGSVLSVYHHYDGYPEWLGKVLVEHYNTKRTASQLIDGGDLSCAWSDENWDGTAKVSPGPLYYNDRGETTIPRFDDTLEGCLENSEEFCYIFRDDKWVCYDTKEWSEGYKQLVGIPSGDTVDEE